MMCENLFYAAPSSQIANIGSETARVYSEGCLTFRLSHKPAWRSVRVDRQVIHRTSAVFVW